MATEILVNDGGAPARIIPMICLAAVSAGDALSADHVGSGDAKCQKLDSGATERHMIGVALTDQTVAGGLVNVVTGKGVVVNINCEDVNGGVPLMAGSTAGRLTTFTDGTALQQSAPVAVTLEDNTAAGLTKCLTI